MPTNQEELAFEVLRGSCPRGGAHLIQKAIVAWPVYDPGQSHEARLCIKCGLRDTFIDEGEASP